MKIIYKYYKVYVRNVSTAINRQLSILNSFKLGKKGYFEDISMQFFLNNFGLRDYESKL